MNESFNVRLDVRDEPADELHQTLPCLCLHTGSVEVVAPHWCARRICMISCGLLQRYALSCERRWVVASRSKPIRSRIRAMRGGSRRRLGL